MKDKILLIYGAFTLYALTIYAFYLFYLNPLRIHLLASAILLSSSLISFLQTYRVSGKWKFRFSLLTVANVTLTFLVLTMFGRVYELVMFLILSSTVTILVVREGLKEIK